MIRLIKRARGQAYTPQNIESAFRATGIVPFNPRQVLGQLSTNAPSPNTEGACNQLATPKKPRAVRSVVSAVHEHLTAVTSPSTRRLVAAKLDKLANAAQQALTENELLKYRIEQLERSLREGSGRQQRGGRRVLSREVAVSGAELLKLREEMDQRAISGSTQIKRDGRRRRTQSSATPTPSIDDSEDLELSDSLSAPSDSEGSVIVVAHRR